MKIPSLFIGLFIPSILEAWYPGQAIADVLIGDYNPGGRFPVTFYKSADDLPAFDDYRVSSGFASETTSRPKKMIRRLYRPSYNYFKKMP